jgi:hypothetical protein
MCLWLLDAERILGVIDHDTATMLGLIFRGVMFFKVYADQENQREASR